MRPLVETHISISEVQHDLHIKTTFADQISNFFTIIFMPVENLYF